MPKFEIIPAIDIMDGKCVRLMRGEFDNKTVYDESPMEAAVKWQDMGATRLHIVDLDGAKTGVFKNLAVIKEIARALKIPVQVGGGIRNKANIEELLHAQIDRIMLGTAVIEDPSLVREMCEKYDESIAVSIDARGGKTAIRGWQVQSDKSPIDLAREAVSLGVKRFIYTDISKDGALAGPNIEEVKSFVKAVKAAVIASGGVSSYKDIEEIRKLTSLGVEGCVVGKALYNGVIDLPSALKYNSI